VSIFARVLVLALVLCHGLARAETDIPDSAPTDVPGVLEIAPHSFARIDGVLANFHRRDKRSFAFEVGPKLIELKAFYLEKFRQDDPVAELRQAPPHSTRWGNYFDLSAVSSQLGGKLVGESELAYSTLGFAALPQDQPIMTRLGLRGNWGKAGYGLAYRSFGGGFVSTTGARVEHARDEKQLWAEYDFGLFRLRGVTGETWERNSLVDMVTSTKTAGTSLQLNKTQWSALLSSTYSIIGQEESASGKTAGLSNDLVLVLRPAGFLTIEPKLGFKKEWNAVNGVETLTPSAALGWSCVPWRDFRLVGQASFAKGVSEDPFQNAATLHTAASLNWHIGRSFLGEQSLAVQLDYRSELRRELPESSQANVIGMIRWKIAGF
jgi:hypothetical protein